MISRRTLLLAAGVLGAGAALSACSQEGGATGGTTKIRYGHWDNGNAQATFAALFQSFMDANEGIEVAQEFASYADFQERMTTQIAGKNVADIFWVASPQVITYYNNNLFHDLDELPGFDFSQYDESMLERIKIDGKLNTMPMGMSIPAFRYNATYLEEAGASLPANWTWDSLAEFLVDYSKDAPAGRYACLYQPAHDLALEGWLRQHGEDLWTEDRKLGASVEALSEYVNWWEKLRAAGATPSFEEQDGVAPGWNDHGAKVLFTVGNQNHIIEASDVYPDYTFKQRVIPTIESPAEGHAFGYLVRLAVYSLTDESKLEAIGKLLEFNLNSAEWMSTLGPVMGAPISRSQQAAARESTDQRIQEVLAVTDETLAAPSRPRFDAPPGSSTWRMEYERGIEAVALGSKSITEAMTEFHKTISDKIG